MVDSSFYKNYGPYSLSDLALKLQCEFMGCKNFKIFDIATLDDAKENEISFFSSNKYFSSLNDTKASVVILQKKYANCSEKNYLISDEPKFLMAEVASIFYPNSDYQNFYFEKKNIKTKFDNSVRISKNSVIHKTASIDKNSCVGSNTIIGPGVVLGRNCIIGDNVSIYFSKVSKNVKIYQGCKIGGEGFGFSIRKGVFKKIPQLGRVLIDENVEVGCNSTIDRGSIGDTVIKKNTMIDNLVHIGHNVKIGKNCIIAAMTGISGSTTIGDYTIIGGQAGISGHLKIGNNVKIAAKSGVMKDIKDGGSVGGYPARNIIDWHRTSVLNKKRLRNEFKK